MKPVTFNSILDVYEFCSEDFKKKKSRDKALQEEEERINKKLKGESTEDDKMDTEEEKAGEEDAEDAALQAALKMSMQGDEGEAPKPVGPGLPPNFQGQYELFAVVTHKGRDAGGGHYMSRYVLKNHEFLHTSSKVLHEYLFLTAFSLLQGQGIQQLGEG